MAMNTDEAPHWHIPKSSLRKLGGEFARKCDPTHISTSAPAILPWIMQPRYRELAVQGRGRSDSSCNARTFLTSQLVVRGSPDCGCPLSQHHKHSIFRDIRGRFPCATIQRMSPTSNWKSRGFLLPASSATRSKPRREQTREQSICKGKADTPVCLRSATSIVT